jgi:hypothetical protein
VEQQLCVLACSWAGDTGALVIAIVALAWGLWQRRSKVRTDLKVAALDATRTQLEAEVRALSLRPPAFVITAPAPISVAPPAPPADDRAPDERLD